MREWSDFLQHLEQDLGRETVQKWLRSLKISRFDARNLFLEAKDPLQLTWFEEHIRPRLKRDFLNQNGTPFHVSITPSQTNSSKSTPDESHTKGDFSLFFDQLDAELDFDHFAVAEENRVPFELLKHATETLFNPIYLYGPTFCGKTHLLNACAQLFQKAGKKVFYVRASTFTSHVVQAIRKGAMQTFRDAYRSVDALLVDDVDQFAKRDATQEEFFHTFNALHTAGKPLIFASSSPPSLLEGIEPRLVSRFEWGISLKLTHAPSLEILRKKALLWKIHCSDALLTFLATAFPEKPVLALQALCLRAKTPSDLSVDQAKEVLCDLLSEVKRKPLTLERIIQETAHYFGILEADILGKGQRKEFVQPRKIAMALCRNLLDMPYQKIGQAFHKDHSTVISSIKAIQGTKERDLIDALKSIDQSLKS